MLTYLKRFSFLALTNFAIMMMISVILSLTGLNNYLTASGINYQSLMVFCLLWGTLGSFVSLWISKWMAYRAYGVEQIKSTGGRYGDILHMTHQLAEKAGLKTMPEVGVYQSADLNAFATGPSKSKSLVAVSTGLVERMSRDEIEGVLAHEVAHIKNGDMVTMTLIQGVMNSFVLFLTHIAMFAIENALRGDDDDGPGLGFFARFIVFNLLSTFFGFFAMFITSGFSRWREFRADAGGAELAGKRKMIAALEALKTNVSIEQEQPQEETAIAALRISNKTKWLALLSTHPPLEKRVQALANSSLN